MNTKEFRQCLENIAIHFLHNESCIYMYKHFTLLICTNTFLFLRSAISYLRHKNELKEFLLKNYYCLLNCSHYNLNMSSASKQMEHFSTSVLEG